MGKYLDKEGVKHLWGKIKALVDNAKRDAINAARYTLPAANGSTLGGVKSGGDVTITGGVVSVNDDSHNHVIGNVDGLQAALDAKAPTASPTLTGTPKAPTATAGTNTTQIATTAFVQSAIGGLKKGLPGGVASLDSSGKVPAAQLPGFVDDMLEFAGTVSGVNVEANFTLNAGAVVVFNKTTGSFVAKATQAGKVTYHTDWGNLDGYPDSEQYSDEWVVLNGNHYGRKAEAGKIYVDVLSNKTYRWSGSGLTEISASLALGETSSTAYPGDKGKAAYAHAMAKGKGFGTNLWKFATNAEGHVISAALVTKEDITKLGIPATDTRYGMATSAANGLMSKEDKAKLDGIVDECTIQSITVDEINGMDAIAKIKVYNVDKGKSCMVFRVTNGTEYIGFLEIIVDSMAHQVVQRLMGNFAFSSWNAGPGGTYCADSLSTGHVDGAPTAAFRVFNLKSPYADTSLFPQGKWSPWYDEHQFLTRNFYTRDEAMTTADIDEATKY